MARIGRPPSCECGMCEKCKRARYMRERYARQTPEQRQAERANRDRERVREQDRKRSRKAERRAYQAARSRQYTRTHPEKRRAHNAVARAIKRGELQRGPCEQCGTTRRVEAHHEDYAKPLEVRWLCRVHHVALHY